MTRVVSRLYTDYIQAENSCETRGSLLRDSLPLHAVQEQMSTAPAGGRCDVTAGGHTLQGTMTKRIFVARLPVSITETELREHFETYGVVEDAYRPRDFAKNTFRGIGFVTFTDPAAVDRVMSEKHTLGGVDVIVDRATPKEKSYSSSSSKKTEPEKLQPPSPAAVETLGQCKQVESGDEAARTIPSAEQLANNYPTAALLAALNEQAFDLNFINSISPKATYPSSTGNNNRGPPSNISDDFLNDPVGHQSGGGGLMTGEMHDVTGIAARCVSAAAPISMHEMNQSMTLDAAMNLTKTRAYSPQTQSITTTTTTAQHEKSPKAVTGNIAHVRKVRGGPRIFVGKIAKSTVEQDLADHFSQFGFVVDVYIPRSRENKKEHRGFGFVTFETEAAIKRAISHGTHTLKGSVLAIDVAVPEKSQNH